jgi:hypothetical protein
MPIGAVGTTAWALLITVTDPIPSPMTQWEPAINIEQEAQCQLIAEAINSKAQQAGIEGKISARCAEIEFLEIPAELKRMPQEAPLKATELP